MLWGKATRLLASVACLVIFLPACVQSTPEAVPTAETDGSSVEADLNQTEDSSATVQSEQFVNPFADKCREVNKTFPFGLGNESSAGPFDGNVQWKVSNELYKEYSDLDGANEGLVCFRAGLLEMIQSGSGSSFEHLRRQLEKAEMGPDTISRIAVKDLMPLANAIFGIRSGQEILFDLGPALVSRADRVLDASALSGEGFEKEAADGDSVSLEQALEGECLSLGATAEIEGDVAECRYESGLGKIWMNTSDLSSHQLTGTQTSDWDLCRIEDRRRQAKSLGTSFPITPYIRMSNPERANLAIVPIDFPDAQATASIDEFFSEDIQIFDRLLAQWAGNNQVFNWHLPDEWIRMPKDSVNYNYDHYSVQDDGTRTSDGYEQVMSNEEQAFDVFSAAEKVMDLDEIDFVYIIAWPKSDVRFAPYSADRFVKTATTTYDFPYYGFGYQILEDRERGEKRPLWHFLFHEMLHFRGLAGHGPRLDGKELFYSVMGSGMSMLGWDAFLVDWLDEDQVLCFDAATLESSTFTLSSSDTGLPGPRVAIVRLSSTQVLVVESRRKGWFESFLPDGFAAIHAYVVDSVRSGERTEEETHAWYLRTDNDPGLIPDSPYGDSRRRLGDGVSAFPGDTFTHEGIVVEFVQSGSMDLVTISKSD